MSTVIDKDDKIWKMFIQYCRLIDEDAIAQSLDVYGTEQRSNMAMSLTQSHMMDHIVCELKNIQKLHCLSGMKIHQKILKKKIF